MPRALPIPQPPSRIQSLAVAVLVILGVTYYFGTAKRLDNSEGGRSPVARVLGGSEPIPQKSSRLRPWARKCKDPECLTSPKLPVEPEVQKTTRLNPLLRTILAGQKGLEVGGPSALLHESFEVYQNLASLDNCQFSAKTLWQGEVARNFKYLEVREPGKVLQPLHKPLKFHSYNFLLASNTLSMQ
jgi:hypothetical protein